MVWGGPCLGGGDEVVPDGGKALAGGFLQPALIIEPPSLLAGRASGTLAWYLSARGASGHFGCMRTPPSTRMVSAFM